MKKMQKKILFTHYTIGLVNTRTTIGISVYTCPYRLEDFLSFFDPCT